MANSRHGQVNLENALAQDDGCYAFRYPEHIAANPAPEISQNQQYVHQENNWVMVSCDIGRTADVATHSAHTI